MTHQGAANEEDAKHARDSLPYARGWYRLALSTAASDVITVYLRGRAQYALHDMAPLFANVELQDVTTLCGD